MIHSAQAWSAATAAPLAASRARRSGGTSTSTSSPNIHSTRSAWRGSPNVATTRSRSAPSGRPSSVPSVFAGPGARAGGGAGLHPRGARPRLGPRGGHGAARGGRSGHGGGDADRDAAGAAGGAARRPDPVRGARRATRRCRTDRAAGELVRARPPVIRSVGAVSARILCGSPDRRKHLDEISAGHLSVATSDHLAEEHTDSSRGGHPHGHRDGSPGNPGPHVGTPLSDGLPMIPMDGSRASSDYPLVRRLPHIG